MLGNIQGMWLVGRRAAGACARGGAYGPRPAARGGARALMAARRGRVECSVRRSKIGAHARPLARNVTLAPTRAPRPALHALCAAHNRASRPRPPQVGWRITRLSEEGRLSHEQASLAKAWNTLRGRECVALARELLVSAWGDRRGWWPRLCWFGGAGVRGRGLPCLGVRVQPGLCSRVDAPRHADDCT
jgi:hypothetical protein